MAGEYNSSSQAQQPLDIFSVYRRCLNDCGFVKLTADRFRDKIGAIADQLFLALASRQLTEAHRLAHSLRSVAAHMSAATLCDICFRVERAAKANDLPTAIESAAPLHDEITRCIAYLPSALSELEAAA